MNKENLAKVIADLDDLKNLIEFFSTQDNIPSIEIDIVKRKLQDIYLLFNDNSGSKPNIQNENKFEPAQEKKTVEPVIKLKEEPEFEIERQVEETISPKEEISEKETIKPTQEVKPPKSNSNGTLSDKLSGNNVSLNERLSNKKGSDLSSRLQKGPIKDLNEAIGLNDKFSYIKTLFNGDAHRFREAIEQLNATETPEEAESYISTHFNWDMEDSITQQFLDLIHRKLQSNG